MYIVSQDVGVAISNAVINADTIIQRDPVTLSLTVEASGETVRLTGPTWNWQAEGGPEAVDNGDGTWTVTLEDVVGDVEYLWVVDGVRRIYLIMVHLFMHVLLSRITTAMQIVNGFIARMALHLYMIFMISVKHR